MRCHEFDAGDRIIGWRAWHIEHDDALGVLPGVPGLALAGLALGLGQMFVRSSAASQFLADGLHHIGRASGSLPLGWRRRDRSIVGGMLTGRSAGSVTLAAAPAGRSSVCSGGRRRRPPSARCARSRSRGPREQAAPGKAHGPARLRFLRRSASIRVRARPRFGIANGAVRAWDVSGRCLVMPKHNSGGERQRQRALRGLTATHSSRFSSSARPQELTRLGKFCPTSARLLQNGSEFSRLPRAARR